MGVKGGKLSPVTNWKKAKKGGIEEEGRGIAGRIGSRRGRSSPRRPVRIRTVIRLDK